MAEISTKQFGLIVAFLIPGFVGLVGVAPLMPLVGGWLAPVNLGDFGIGPTIYAIMAAIAVGMILSCVRWLIIDHLLRWMGVRPPVWDFRQLESCVEALDYLSDNHYRYFQFYGNTIVAILWSYSVNRFLQTSSLLGAGTDLGVFILCAVLFAGCRDALARYYERAGQLVGEVAEKESSGDVMTNGIGHHEGGGASSKPRPEAKPEAKNVVPAKRDDAKSKGGTPSK